MQTADDGSSVITLYRDLWAEFSLALRHICELPLSPHSRLFSLGGNRDSSSLPSIKNSHIARPCALFSVLSKSQIKRSKRTAKVKTRGACFVCASIDGRHTALWFALTEKAHLVVCCVHTRRRVCLMAADRNHCQRFADGAIVVTKYPLPYNVESNGG